MVLLLIAIIFLVIYACLIIFYWKNWESGKNYINAARQEPRFLSIIIAARDEEKNIGSLLNALEEQSYPIDCFETIVVDDFSSDNTAAIVRDHSLNNLKLIQPAVAEEHSSKKKAIEAGIERARGELVITTDADCLPGKDWLISINDLYVQEDASFIAAPVKFVYDNSIVEKYQAIDFMILQGITAASVSSGFHSMCNGANLAYKKRSFVSVNGFEGIDQVATGDDMLLMHKVKKLEPDRVFYLKKKEAIVSTRPMPSWKQFFSQRKRWASKTLVYDDSRIIAVLFFILVFNLFFFALLGAAFFNDNYWWLVAGYVGAKFLIELLFVRSIAKFFGEERLLPWLLVLQPVHIFNTVFIGMASQFGNYEWKRRSTK